MSDSLTIIHRLLEANVLREPVLRAAIQAIQLPEGSDGLDIGCGIGLQAQLLANAVGEKGRITGVDIDPELIAYGEKLAQQAGLLRQLSFQKGDMRRLPFADQSFDWVWSADCLGYPAGDFPALLKETMRVIRPGGRVIILAWSSQQLLPGYPILEARLNAMHSSYAPYLKGRNPEDYFLRAPRWFQEAGLQEVRAQTFVGGVQPPLCLEERVALVSLIGMLWEEPAPGASIEDWGDYQRLCKPGSPDFILDQPGYYAFYTYTLVEGKKANQ